MFDPVRPFVLLDDASTGRATLFTGPAETVEATTAAEVAPALARLRSGGDWAGFIGYEAGHALEPRLAAQARPVTDTPLLWFARFTDAAPVDVDALLAGHGAARLGRLEPGISEAAHAAALARVQALIAAGDIYQANLTFPARLEFSGHPLALYAALRPGSRAPYGALVHTGRHWLLSFSPELFFNLHGRTLTARPMKGTARRGADAAEDTAIAAALQADPKNRAENLMIVDLLRNDLSRVASKVEVPALFEVETYPSILQMTSTITAEAHHGITAADVLARLFPCGSVTGAPKIRAMEVIAEVEPAPRGPYTGSIGAVRANGDAVFNVAIRTLVIGKGDRHAALGLGSGIIADSDPAAEWQECLAKAAFLSRGGPPDLIETMRLTDGQLPDLEAHLIRMSRSAAFLGLSFDEAAARAVVAEAIAGVSDGRLRLLASPAGHHAVQLSAPPPPLALPLRVKIVPLPVSPADWRLRHKTSDRAFYDNARKAAGTAEVLFETDDGQLTEGSFTTLFVSRGDRLLTPPAALGLLPGVLRARLLASGEAVESPLTRADLVHGFFVGNALRGLMPAILAL
ncbi:aminodeoxychorismate synthase component I [Polymorphobacter sp.]|uniref:aminodeoxychorismate synthase component I n=1 Tax=Polymorphobacter sp. TaxID=1909290 RepID=UPI003F72D86F